MTVLRLLFLLICVHFVGKVYRGYKDPNDIIINRVGQLEKEIKEKISKKFKERFREISEDPVFVAENQPHTQVSIP